jgi:REP element-mobilizing transposase RayT
MEQYVIYPPMTEKQMEWMKEQLFRKEGPFYHLSTKPLENGIIFECEEERKVAMNLMAITAKEFKIDILAFALMSNHFHFIIRGEFVNGLSFFNRFRKKLSNYFSRRGRAGILDTVNVDPDTPPIESLTQLRNEIAYVIRNPYVARKDVNPFACFWCSGYLYFNPFLPMLPSRSINELTYKEKRLICHSATMDLDSSFRVRDGMITPESFVNYELVERLFPNAQKFAWWVLKNLEAQHEVANRLGERPNLNDDELFLTAQQTARGQFGFDGVNEMPTQKRKELAILLKNKWGASNGQLARIAKLDQRTVDEMFPLTAKQKK